MKLYLIAFSIIFGIILASKVEEVSKQGLVLHSIKYILN
jgi:hypothetical protein